jgi:hypothetical protein
MEPQAAQPDDVQSAGSADREIEDQVCLLLQRHRRLSFLALADSVPTNNWRSLFLVLNRLSRQRQVGVMPLVGGYEVVWLHGREESRVVSDEPCLRI